MIVAIAYLMVTLVPIHGALYLGIRNENVKKRLLLKSLWQVRNGGRR